MATEITLRKDTEANWNSNDPTLASGEVGLVLDGSDNVVGVKIGKGSAWLDTPMQLPIIGGIANAVESLYAEGADTGVPYDDKVTFLLKGLSSQATKVFGVEAVASTDTLLTIDKNGDVAIGDGTDDRISIVASTGAITLDSTADITINEDKFTIDADTGDTVTRGDLTIIDDVSDANRLTVDAATGDVAVNTDKVTVDGDTGDIVVAGNITGDDSTTLYAPADVAKADGGGSVVQMQYAQWTTPQNGPGYGAHADAWGTDGGGAAIQITPITISITPTSANSVILLDLQLRGGMYRTMHSLFWFRRTVGVETEELRATSPGNRDAMIGEATHTYMGSDSTYMGQLNIKYVDIPATTDEVTYDLWFSGDATYEAYFFINRTYWDTDEALWKYKRFCSIFTATELAAKA